MNLVVLSFGRIVPVVALKPLELLFPDMSVYKDITLWLSCLSIEKKNPSALLFAFIFIVDGMAHL